VRECLSEARKFWAFDVFHGRGGARRTSRARWRYLMRRRRNTRANEHTLSVCGFKYSLVAGDKLFQLRSANTFEFRPWSDRNMCVCSSDPMGMSILTDYISSHPSSARVSDNKGSFILNAENKTRTDTPGILPFSRHYKLKMLKSPVCQCLSVAQIPRY